MNPEFEYLNDGDVFLRHNELVGLVGDVSGCEGSLPSSWIGKLTPVVKGLGPLP